MNIWSTVLVCSIFVCLCSAVHQEDSCSLPSNGNRDFPPKFSFGVITSAYQIEGGWKSDGKGLSIWDDFTHNNKTKENGDVSADSYDRFDQDLVALKQLKVNHYIFSIAWTRIFPNGDISTKNKKGIKHYADIIEKLLKSGIKPVIIMCDNDLPLELQKLGGFASSLFINKFQDYAATLFENYGDKVKTWITFRDPYNSCVQGYGTGKFPPQIHGSGTADYACVDNIIRAHAGAYRIYQKMYSQKQSGKVGISLSSEFYMSTLNDTKLVDQGMQYRFGWLAEPIFGSGGYPQDMVKDIQRNAKKEGRLTSRLPIIEKDWKDIIKDSADFLGLEYYTSKLIAQAEDGTDDSEVPVEDINYALSVDSKWEKSEVDWLFCVPQGLQNLLAYIKEKYNNVEVFITANGWPEDGTKDKGRIKYLKSHLQAVLNSINAGSNVIGYTVRSLIDGFEWLDGFQKQYGLYFVDFNSKHKDRIARKSANYYKEVISMKMIPG